MQQRLIASVLVLGFLAIGIFSIRPLAVVAADQKAPDPAAVERTREQVKMLDDLYKIAVVGITETYVNQQDDTPAATVAKKLFAAMHKKGHHFTRLIDVTGKPKNKDNDPESEFELKAAKAIKGGKTHIDEIGEKDGKPILRAATVVPAVVKQCAQCHNVKEGTVLGALIYELPIK